MAKEYIMTAEMLDKMKERLQYLKTVARKEVAQKISVARDFGDLSENAEYSAAREEQSQIEGEILELETKINNAKILESGNVNKSTVSVGCKVKIRDIDMEEDLEYTIVGTVEVDINENKISNESPIGKALMGKKVGDIVTVQTARAEIKFEILSIA